MNKEYKWNENGVCVNPDHAFTLTFGKNPYDKAIVEMAQDESGAWHYGIQYPAGGFLPHREYDFADKEYNAVLDYAKAHLRTIVERQLAWCENNAKIRSACDEESLTYESHAIKMYRHFLNEMAQPTLF